MQPPDLDPCRSAEALAADIEAYIGEALRCMEAGEILSLGELEGAVDVLCQRVLNQRDEEKLHFIPLLEGLRTQLDGLQGQMQSAQQRIRLELDNAVKHQKASRAYRNPKDQA